MKRFIFSIFCVSVFFIGVGALVEKTGAKFKSDEKALALIAKARQAIGGDSAIGGVQSLRIVGQTTRNFKVDGVDRAETGDTEIALQFPDKVMRMTKIGHGDENSKTETSMTKQIDVTVVGGDKDNMKVTVNGEGQGEGPGTGVKKIIIKKDDGTVQELSGEDAEKWIAEPHSEVGGDNRIILRKSDGQVKVVNGDKDVKVGDATENGIVVRKIDGNNAVFTAKTPGTITSDGDQVIINRVGGGDKAENGSDHMFLRHGGGDGEMRHNDLLRLTLGLLLTAPKGMDVSYTFGGESDVDGTACNIVVADFGGSSFKIYLGQASNLPVMMSYTGVKMPQVFLFKTKSPDGGEDTKQNVVFSRKVEGPDMEKAEINVKFSDYRSVNGVQLPYKWTQTGGEADETFDVTSYEINPANIAEKFQNQKVMVRTKKPDGQ